MASLRLPAQPRAARLVAPRPQARAVVAKASYVADPVPIAIKGADGSDKGSGQLSLKVADPKTARHVVHRYLVLVRQNARQGTASSKTRAMVSGGGRKPYQQKGSGRARQGSKTSPLLRGGGVVFGPKPKDWSISMNKKEKRLAMATALQSAACDITAVQSFKSIEAEPKTRNLVQLCKSVGVDPMQTYTLVITKEKNEMVYRAGRNIGRMQINDAHHLRVYDVLRADKIIVEAAALNVINQRFNGSDTKASKSGGGRGRGSGGKGAASEPSSALEPGGEEALKQLDEAAQKSGDGSVEPAPADAQVEVETAEVAPSAAPEADSDDPKEATKA